MSDRTVILALARVIVAAAWADGRLTREEVDSLKDLLFRLPHVGPARGVELPAQDWAALELYMQAPVDAAERARLVADLQAELRAPADRALALEALDALVRADGAVTPEEEAVAREIRAALEAVDLGLLARLGRLVSGPVRRRTAAVAAEGGREAELGDFVRNRIYFQVRRLQLPEGDAAVSEAALRKLSLAAGLLARVAHAESGASPAEVGAIEGALAARWGLSAAASAAIAEVALSAVAADLDFFRLTREFFTATEDEERVRFLGVLFAIAQADGRIAPAELEEIRRIARGLNIAQQQVNDALDLARRATGPA